jgi:hypothetical protein
MVTLDANIYLASTMGVLGQISMSYILCIKVSLITSSWESESWLYMY